MKCFDTNYFIDRNVMHIRRVQDNMILLEKNRDKLPFKIKQFELLRRGMYHDLSKFSRNFIKAYIDSSRYYYNVAHGLSCEDINIEKIKSIKNIHYLRERHHPHFKKKMTNLDICEMCSDLAAVAWENKERNYTDYYVNIHMVNFPMLDRYNNTILKILKLLEDLNR